MSKSNFTNIRNRMHTFSRAPLATGQEWIDQATAPAGHNTSIEKVRADEIPAISSLAERDEMYLVQQNGKRVVGGYLGRDVTNVLKFLDRVDIQEIPNTNGESWLIVDSDGTPYKDFVDPADKPISQIALSDGYEVLMFSEDGHTKISRNCGWSFDSFNGIIHFDPKFNPKTSNWQFGNPKIEGFVYIGKYVGTLLSEMQMHLDAIAGYVDAMANNHIAIQPFKFTTQEMTVVGTPYEMKYGGDQIVLFQRLAIIIPGYVFEVTSLDNDETILTDLRHLKNGNTEVFIDVLWHEEYACPIIDYQYDSGESGVGNKIPVIGKCKYVASALMTSNGQKIDVKPTVDYEANPEEVLPVPEYEPSTPYEDGTPVAPMVRPPTPYVPSQSGTVPPRPPHPPRPPYPRPPFGGNVFYGPLSDDDTIINVYGGNIPTQPTNP